MNKNEASNESVWHRIIKRRFTPRDLAEKALDDVVTRAFDAQIAEDGQETTELQHKINEGQIEDNAKD
ncbi:MAG TPA: hypothetical protein VFN31_02035 [Candidatus Saccharimonadales bacterium]|nr:hypothetical protein [Candidatus Saccharimonadales bacterium]